ncbi:hypothetical protein ES702_07684 [subsurface metagenome]
MSLFVGAAPDWFKEFKWSDLWGGVKEDAAKIPKAVGDTISAITKPILSGVRSALTPTVIWLVIIGIVALLLYTYFKKAVKI